MPINLNPYSIKSVRSISTIAVVVIIVVILIIAGAAAYFLLVTSSTTSTTSSVSNTTATSNTSTGVSSSSSPTGSSSSSNGSSSSSSSSSTGSASINTLTIDDIGWPLGGLNQLTSVSAIPFPNWLTYTVYQSLVTLNGSALNDTGAIQFLPMLAQNWTVSSDGTTYTFNLRNVSFTDGNPLTSYNLWGEFYGLYYLTANNSNWWLDYPIFNMNDTNFGPLQLGLMNQSGVVHPSAQLLAYMHNTTWPIYAPNPSQIVFHLLHPFAYFLGTMVVFQGLVFDTQFVLDHGGFGPPAVFNSYFTNNPIPGTGPYEVTPGGITVNSIIKFQKNPNYWGDSLSPAQIRGNEYLDPGHVQNVIVQVKADDLARYTDLSGSSATAPVISTILDQDWPKVNGSSTYAYSTVPQKSMLINGIAMNTLRYPTNIRAVRNAIYYAINYSDISQKVYQGKLFPWVGPEYPSWTQYYNLGNSTPWPTNMSKAKALLDAACSANSTECASKFPTLDFRILQGCTFCLNTATIVASNLATLGIHVNVEQTPSANYACGNGGVAGPCSFATSANFSQGESQLTWLGAFTFAPGADTPADSWLGWVNGNTPANNWAIYSNPTVQKCDYDFVNGASNSTLLSDCTAAQMQINNDTPYAWIGSLALIDGSGSVVWNKNQVTGGLLDPVYTGQSDTLIFNTVTFTNGQ